jgi:hypothetical protein
MLICYARPKACSPDTRESDRQAHAHVVLPLSGEVALEIEGRQGRLDPLHAALVAPGAWHSLKPR